MKCTRYKIHSTYHQDLQDFNWAHSWLGFQKKEKGFKDFFRDNFFQMTFTWNKFKEKIGIIQDKIICVLVIFHMHT